MDDFYEEKSGDLSVRRDQIDAFIEEDVNEDHNHRDLQGKRKRKLTSKVCLKSFL